MNALKEQYEKLHKRWVESHYKDPAINTEFIKIAEAGLPEAQELAGNAYSCGGWGFEKNLSLAIKYCELAAKNINSENNYLSLALIFDPFNELNKIEPYKRFQSKEKADHFYKLAFETALIKAKSGDHNAMSTLADFCAGSYDQQPNEEQKLYWLDKLYLEKEGMKFHEWLKQHKNA